MPRHERGRRRCSTCREAVIVSIQRVSLSCALMQSIRDVFALVSSTCAPDASPDTCVQLVCNGLHPRRDEHVRLLPSPSSSGCSGCFVLRQCRAGSTSGSRIYQTRQDSLELRKHRRLTERESFFLEAHRVVFTDAFILLVRHRGVQA